MLACCTIALFAPAVGFQFVAFDDPAYVSTNPHVAGGLTLAGLRWATNLAPRNPRYHTWLGVALTRTKKRLHEAEEHCKTAIALDGGNAQHHLHLGQVYRAGHLFDKARQQFETALRLDPKNPGALKEIRELEPSPETGLLGRFLGK